MDKQSVQMTTKDKIPAGRDEWVSRLKAGDETAVGELFRGYQAKAYALCLSILKNETDARETAMDALEQVTRNIGQFDGQSRFNTWLCRVVVNFALMRRRNQTRQSARFVPLEFLNEDAAAASDASAAVPAADGQVLADDAVRTLESLCARLPDAYCPVVALVDFQGRSVPEAAAALGLTLANGKSRLNRGRTLLRQFICQMGELCGPWCRPH